ncbi:hypothetical protein [Lentzea aerocolonigenes]|uniref:hypothetical protein n=1 Tax=Lentzea aerocolonigenes TaxID=68170 RepID=UPI00068D1690|nr:hypothetical protein [Lentzea aerocolonigenes]MCP2244254.1 cytidylate kinase [Lentzea aerocolonigenes]
MDLPGRPARIVISGCTAAGKTTHARLLARELGWRYVGMSTVMRELLGVTAQAREWEPGFDARRAADVRIDRVADERMTEFIAGQEKVVVDAWLQPWLQPAGTAVNVWFESDHRSRAMKCAVSFLRNGEERSLAASSDLVAAKDLFSREQFARLYGISFSYSPEVFDLRCDNSGFIRTPTVDDSDRGIRDFQRVLMRDVEGLLADRPS